MDEELFNMMFMFLFSMGLLASVIMSMERLDAPYEAGDAHKAKMDARWDARNIEHPPQVLECPEHFHEVAPGLCEVDE